MAQLLFLNERSYGPGHIAIPVAQESLATFVDVLLQIKKLLPRVSLISSESLSHLRLGNGYSVASWLNSGAANRERGRVLLSLANQAPFRVVNDLYDDPDPGVTVHRYGDEIVEGIGLANLYGGVPISLDIEDRWRVSTLSLNVQQLVEDEERAWIIEMPHAASVQHVHNHQQWLLTLRKREVANADDLYERRAELFPFLAFTPSVKANLEVLQHPAFGQVVHYLCQLDDAVNVWDPRKTTQPKYPPHTTNESASRKELCYLPDIECGRDYFTWHGRYTPGAGRIHFKLEYEPKRVVLGYIGKKLGT
ncbi:hypothetical protein [Edaphobacter sp. DSM 109919]|uniref:Uncharacterized protein n=1 Tax=Edaphobacter paludis TaxID=3035702 RepID=A0AAU7CUP5_9BACT